MFYYASLRLACFSKCFSDDEKHLHCCSVEMHHHRSHHDKKITRCLFVAGCMLFIIYQNETLNEETFQNYAMTMSYSATDGNADETTNELSQARIFSTF